MGFSSSSFSSRAIFIPNGSTAMRGVLSDVAIGNGKQPGRLSPPGSLFVNVSVAGQSVLARLKVFDVIDCC